MIPAPLLVWVGEIVIASLVAAAAGAVAAAVFGAISEDIVQGKQAEAEARVRALDDVRRQEIVETFLQERHRMSPEERAAWEELLDGEGLLQER